MKRNPRLHSLAAVLLLFALVAAEALSVRHSLDFEGHTPGEPCKICIGVAALGSGAPAKSPSPDVPRVVIPGCGFHVLPVDLPTVERPSARSPPPVS